MKKKIFSELLMGAFLLASISSFVSCKDYDDDIKDLQEQVNSLSGVVTQKETTINSSITSLQAALTTLENAYKTGDDATLAAAKQAVADAKKDLEEAIKTNYNSQVEKNAALDAAILKAQNAADQALKQLESKADVAQITQLQQDLQAAQAALQAAIDGKAAQAEVDALNTEVANLKKAQADAESALAKVQTDLANAQTALQDAIAKKADQATLDALQQQVDALKTSLEAKDKELADAIAALENAQKALEAAISKKADQADLEALQKKVDDLKTALEAKDVELANNIKKAQDDITAVSNDLKDLTTKFNTLSDDLKAAVERIATLEEALKGQQAALAEAQANIAANAGNIAANAGNIATNAGNIATNAGNIAANADAIEEIQGKIKTLSDDLATYKKTVEDAMAEETKRVNDKFDVINGTIEALKAAHATFATKTALKEVSDELEAFEGRVNDLMTQIDAKFAAVDVKINTLVAALAKTLRSLVYMPNLYVDGIETIEYPYLRDTVLHKTATYQYTRENDGKKITLLEDYLFPGEAASYTIAQSEWFTFGPAWEVEYHMNPAIANVKWADIQGYNAYKVEVVTRGATIDHKSNTNLTITSPEKFENGEQLFKTNTKGILTAGIKVAAPQDIVNEKNGKNNTIVALQAKAPLTTGTGKDTLITSDYAMLMASKVWLEGLVWTKSGAISKEGRVNVGSPVNCDEIGDCGKKVHVWNTPEEALEDNGDNADVFLYYDGEKGFDLQDYLGVHYVRESITNAAVNVGTWNFTNSELARYGLSYKFDLIDYEVDGNVTRDSRFLNITDSKKGSIITKNVAADGQTTVDTRIATVGREPLVRVRVFTTEKGENKPVLDGYILVKIVKEDPAVEEPGIKVITDYPTTKFTFDFCNGGTIWKTNWSQFHSYVLDLGLDLDKDDFDRQYEPDLVAGSTTQLKLFSATTGNGVLATYGTATYVENTLDMTNHTYYVDLTATELENLTHDQASLPRTITLYIRYKAKEGAGAKYKYVYVQVKVELNRNAAKETTIAEKNKNYWYRIDGNDDGFDGIALNTFEPMNGLWLDAINRPIINTFVQNKVTMTNGANRKFFFLPAEYEITDQNGTTWVVSPQRSANDQVWKYMICLYNLHTYDMHVYAVKQETKNGESYWVADDAANKKVLDNCVIDVNKGVYTNVALYAHIKNTTNFIKIADLVNPTTDGEIQLIKNETTKLILNAIGFAENKGNFNKQMRAYLGTVGWKGDCDFAWHTTNASFLASWERPINVDEVAPQQAIDANTNGNYIYALDFLHMFDWRGYPIDANGNKVAWNASNIDDYRGDMEGIHKWFWSFYGVKAISIDCTPSKVMTNMHQTPDTKFVKLSEVTTKAHLYALKADGTGVATATKITYDQFDIKNYNSASKNQALLDYMEANKALFGGIYYENNGDNVEDFIVKLPVTISYEWGDFVTSVSVHIIRSIGQ